MKFIQTRNVFFRNDMACSDTPVDHYFCIWCLPLQVVELFSKEGIAAVVILVCLRCQVVCAEGNWVSSGAFFLLSVVLSGNGAYRC